MTSDEVPLPPLKPRWQRWFVYSRFGRVLVFVILFLALHAILALLMAWLGWRDPAAAPELRLFARVISYVVPPVCAYLLLVYGIEQRTPDELALRKVVPHGVAGFLFGAAFVSSVVAILWLAGAYRVTGFGTEVRWAAGLLIAGLGAGVAEEIIFRGIMFRLAEERWGLGRALAFSAAFFGLAHIMNPGASAWSSAAIAIEAGVLLGLVYHVTRSLPACMGVHMGWNFVQGTIFGSNVSGTDSRHSWLQPLFSGPDWLTGGKFGIEASVVTVMLSLLVSAALLWAARRRQQPDNAQDAATTGMAPC